MAEASAKPRTPVISVRFGPNMSLIRPPRRRKPPKASVYAVTTHCRSVFENPRECWADGRAMIMIVESSTTMSWAPAMTTRIHQCARVVPPDSVSWSAPCSVVTGSPPIDSPPTTGRALERIRSTCFWLRGRCGNAASAGRMPAIEEIEMAPPRLGCVGAGGLQHATHRPHHERNIGARQVRADPAVRLRVGEEPGDQVPRRLDEVVVGVPELGEAAQVLRLIRTRRHQEVLEACAIRQPRRLAGHGDRRPPGPRRPVPR